MHTIHTIKKKEIQIFWKTGEDVYNMSQKTALMLPFPFLVRTVCDVLDFGNICVFFSSEDFEMLYQIQKDPDTWILYTKVIKTICVSLCEKEGLFRPSVTAYEKKLKLCRKRMIKLLSDGYKIKLIQDPEWKNKFEYKGISSR